MNDYIVTLPGLYISRMAELVEESGVDSERWLEAKGVKHFSPDEIVSLPWQAFDDLLTELGQVSKEVSIGLAFGQRLSINTHGNLGFAIMNSANIREAAHLLKTYLPLRTNLITLDVQEQDNELFITFTECHPLGLTQRLVLQGIVLAIKNIFDFITIGQSGISEVR